MKKPINDDFKAVISMLAIPLFFLFLFYTYFLIVSVNIFDKFNLNFFYLGLSLPHIFADTFKTFGFLAILFGIFRLWRRFFVISFYIVLGIYFIIYMSQYYSLYYTNRYLIPEAFYHLDQLNLLVSTELIVKLLALFFLFSVLCYSAIKMSGMDRNNINTIGKMRLSAIQILTTLICFFIFYQVGNNVCDTDELRRYHGVPADAPEFAYYKVLKQVFNPDHHHIKTLPPDVQRFIADRFGLFYNLENEYPQVKNWVYRNKLPFKRRADATSTPNIIIFFVESLSARLLEACSRLEKTPHIDSFRKESMSINGYFNHTYPTMNGLRGQLCSFYPVLGEGDYAQQERVNYKLLGLPHVLNRQGYETVFFTYSRRLYKPVSRKLYKPVLGLVMNVEVLMKECGFKHLYMAEDIQHRLLNAPKNVKLWEHQISDLGLMANLVNILKERRSEKIPFFFAVSTIGTHMEHGDDSNNIANSVNQFDKAFGVFWNYFQSSPLFNNTIIILTADHAMPPTVEYSKLIRDPTYKKYFFEEIECIIFDKRHNLPNRFETRATSIDLVPSILQLLDLNSFSNPFLGMSMFSDRKKHPYLLSTMMNQFYYYGGRGMQEIAIQYDPNLQKTYNNIADDIFTDYQKQTLALKIWFHYNQYLNENNKIWNGILRQP
ncbi:sulfatase-like hydrolase/transferase [Desulfococcaceae bacterium HSG7]|nr:sulfatase-like hydrolase/transferase [Desulfococcaceae bacterium HSG7]